MLNKIKIQLPFSSFTETADELLGHLVELTLLKTWVLAEVKDEMWIVRACIDDTFGFEVNQFVSWNDSLCRSMIIMGGPQCAPDISKFEHLAKTAAVTRMGIESYLGVPIQSPGNFEGMLCGMDNHVVDENIICSMPLIETFGRVLAGAWANKVPDSPREAPPDVVPGATTAGLLIRKMFG